MAVGDAGEWRQTDNFFIYLNQSRLKESGYSILCLRRLVQVYSSFGLVRLHLSSSFAADGYRHLCPQHCQATIGYLPKYHHFKEWMFKNTQCEMYSHLRAFLVKCFFRHRPRLPAVGLLRPLTDMKKMPVYPKQKYPKKPRPKWKHAA